MISNNRVATNLENMEREMFDKSPMKMYSSEFFSVRLLREKFENALEISGKTQGIRIYLLKNVATLNKQSFISKILKVIGPLGEKFEFFIPLGIQIEMNLNQINTEIKL